MEKAAPTTPKPNDEEAAAEDAATLEAKIQERTRQLEKAKREWEQTFDAIDEPVLILDRSHRIQRANLALARAVQKDIRGLIGKICHEELVDRATPCPECPLHSPQADPSHRGREIVHRQQRPIYNVRSFPMPGNEQWVVHTYHDITEEKEIQAKLIESEKLNHIGMLAGQVAHEINNPLAGILAQAQLLLMDLDAESQGDLVSAVKDIEEASLRCRKIILNLLNFSRRAPTERRERISINALIEHTLPLYHMTPPRPGPTLQLQLAPDLPALLLDEDKLQSVLLNLMCNAKAATPQTGQLTVSTSLDAETGWVLLTVADTGEGIPAEVQQDIFKPFYTTKPKGLGTGLGLYIVEEIVSAHDGTVELTSLVGVGTTFRIALPPASLS